MLTATSLAKRYSGNRDVDAVAGIGLKIDPGQFVAIVGRSGSGKSTLLAMLGGLCRPTSGTVEINSTNLWALRPNLHADFRSQQIGFVFQFASLLPSLRAIDNVALPALIAGILSEKEAYARARTLLEHVGLAKRYDFYPGELSGGEQRRVAIARALINSPKLLLADEPTADLDEETEEDILNLLIDVQKAYDLTLVMVTHNAAIANRADRVIRMKAGLIVSDEEQNVESCSKSKSDSDRARQVFTQSAATVALEKITLGAGVERFIGQLVLLTIPLIALVWLINFGVREIESRLIEQQNASHQAVEDMALTGLRADVKDVTFGQDGTYDVSIYLRNTMGSTPIYVLSPTVRGFVQVGSSWVEVPMRPAGEQVKQLKIEGEQIFHFILKPEVSNYAQLLPYYMHVRFTSEMLVSPSNQPKNDLVDRADSYYVYLKPHNADDKLILQKMKFPGQPPIWIPMPPH